MIHIHLLIMLTTLHNTHIPHRGDGGNPSIPSIFHATLLGDVWAAFIPLHFPPYPYDPSWYFPLSLDDDILVLVDDTDSFILTTFAITRCSQATKLYCERGSVSQLPRIDIVMPLR